MGKIDEILLRLDKQEELLDKLQKRVYVVETKKDIQPLDDDVNWKEWLLALLCIILFIVALFGVGVLFF